MPTATVPMEEKKSVSSTATIGFVVEIDTKRNGDVVLQSIAGVRMRGAIDGSKPIIADPRQNYDDFEKTIPIDQSTGLGVLPKIPGQTIEVNPAKMTYVIVDPLKDNEELCDRISTALKTKGQIVPGGKIVGVKERSGKLDIDHMKTLCRELLWLVEDNDAKVRKGKMPSLDDIEVMKGDFLLNPGSRTQNMQPRLERDFDDWIQNLARSGG